MRTAAIAILSVCFFLVSFIGVAQCEVDAGENVTICQGESVQIGGSPTIVAGGPGVDLDWSNGLGSDENPVVSPNSTTTYTATLSGPGCDDSDQITVTVLPSPNASFTWNPDGDCGPMDVQFTNTSTGSGLTYDWDFDDPLSGNNSSSGTNPSHTFYPVGSGTSTFDVTLTVTDDNGCEDTVTETITVQEAPDPVLTDPIFNFINCDGAAEFTITVFDGTSPSSNANYTIDWGDGSPVWTDTSAPAGLGHTYTGLNVWSLFYTVEGTNGCSVTEEILVANITNPAIGAGTTGNTTVCGPVEICFSLNLYESNHNSTTYTVDFGDGSPTETFNHPPPDQVCHEYSQSSCEGGVPYTFTVVANNLCTFSEATISPIVIYSPPTAGFDATPVPQCVNTPVTFINYSTMGYYNQCAESGIFVWDFGDNTTVTSTTNDNQSHTYTAPGTYTVTLTASNACNLNNPSVFTQDVCIEEPPTVQFTADPFTGCAPFTLNTINNSVVGDVCNINYLWDVDVNYLECTGTNPDYQFTGGTNTSSAEPEIEFLSPGSYTLSLEMVNSCGVFTDVQNVTVQDVPEFLLSTLPTICEGESVSPGAVIDDCLAPILATDWTFPGGSPGSSTSSSPGSVTYNTAGTWNVELEVTNACGSVSQQTPVVVQASPILNITSSAGTAICDGQSTVLTATGAQTYSWTFDSDLSTTSGPITTATPSGTSTYTVTGYTTAGCPSSESITIDIDPLPILSPASVYEICAGDCVDIGVDIAGGLPPYNNYNWSPGGTLDDPSSTTPEACPPSTTNYTVSVTDANGCVGSTIVPVDVNPLPTVNAGPDTQLCNQPVGEQLTGFSPVPGVGESGVWTGPNVDPDGVFTPTATGFFTLTYTFTDSNGCVNSDQMDVEVIDPTTADAGSDMSLCADGVPFQITPVTTGGSWSGTGVDPDGLFTPTTAGTFTLTYSLGGGSCLSTDELDVEVFELPSVNAGTDEIICDGDSVQLNGVVMNGLPPYSNILWSPATSLDDATVLDPWATPSASESYTLSVEDANGCVNNDEVIVDVLGSPVVEAGPNLTLCNQPIPEQLSGFSPIPGVGETGIWTGQNVTVDGEFTPNGAGDFVLTYTFTNAAGCENADSLTITVADPTLADAGPDFEICLNEPAVQLVGGGTWSGTDVTAGGEFTPATSGTFTLTYTIGTGTCENSDDLEVTVHTLPIADAGTDQTLCEADSVLLEGSAMGDNLPIQVYTWTGDLNISTPDQADTWVMPTSTQVYTLTVEDMNGCEDTDDATVNVNQLPVVDAGPDISVCDQPIAETLSGFSPLPGVGETGIWTGTGVVDPDGEFESPGIGVYTLTYTFTDVVGCAASDSIEVTVVAPVDADAGPDQELCLNNGLYQLQGYSPVAGVTWSGTGIVDAINGVFDPTVSGVGVFDLLIEYGSGTCYSTDEVQVEVLPLPVIDPGADEAFCGNATMQTLETFTPTGGTWEGPGIVDPALGTFDPSIGEGAYDLIYWYTDPITGCADTTNKMVTVAPVPVADFTIAPLGCTNAPADIANLSSGATVYQWDWGNTGTSVGFEPSYTYPDEGLFDVQLIAINDVGCEDTLVLNTEIIDPPQAFIALDPEEGCAPLEVAFDNTSIGQYLEYEWDLATSSSTDQFPANIIYQQGDDVVEYPISLVATNFCGSSEALDTVIVLPQPVAGFGTDLDEFCSPWTVNINNISVGNPDVYEWDFGDGTFSSAEEPLTHTYYTDSVATDYTITLVTTNECGVDTFAYTITVLPNTVTAFFNTNVIEGCSPLEVEFTDFSEGGTVIAYDFGDDAVSNNPNPTHTYIESGEYTVLQIVDNGCSYDTASVNITVFPSPVADFETDVPNVCEDQPVQFINLSEDINNASWDFGDGTTSDETNPFHTYEDGGTYTVTLTVTSMFNECPAETSQTFTVNAAPVASFVVNEAVGCSPFIVEFGNTTENGQFYTWDFGDGETGSEEDEEHIYYNDTGDPVSYTITLIAENFALCADTFNADIIVSPTPVSDFLMDSETSCSTPVTVDLTNASIYANNYSWDFGLYGTSDVQNPSVTIDQVGTWPLTLTASNSYGCSDQITQNYVVHPHPEAAFTANPGWGCIDLPVSFTNTSSESATFEWDFGDGNTSSQSSPLHTYEDAGYYGVTLIVTSDEGCQDTLSVANLIAAYPLPVAGFTVEPEVMSIYSPVIQCYDDSQDGHQWFWSFGDGYGSTDANPAHEYATPGTYQIEQLVYNIYGCEDRAYGEVTVEPEFNFYVPNTFTPDADGINDVFLPEILGKDLIEFYEFRIYDRWGVQIFESNDPEQPWLGDYREHESYYVEDDVYVWQAKVRLKGAERSQYYYGHVTMLR